MVAGGVLLRRLGKGQEGVFDQACRIIRYMLYSITCVACAKLQVGKNAAVDGITMDKTSINKRALPFKPSPWINSEPLCRCTASLLSNTFGTTTSRWHPIRKVSKPTPPT